MRVRLSDPSVTPDLVRFLRERDFLAVEEERAIVGVAPIDAISPRADRVRVKRALNEWRARHPEVEIEILAEL